MIKPHFRIQKDTFNAVSLAIIGAAIVLLIAGTAYYIQQERQRAAIHEQTSRTNQLILEVKELGEENKTINQQSRNYAYCNAVLLAKYTQDQQPIEIKDLNKCAITSFHQRLDSNSDAQSSVSTTVNPQSSGNTGQVLQPSSGGTQPTTPPTNSGSGQPPSNQAVTVPGILTLNTPCVELLQLVKTCQ